MSPTRRNGLNEMFIVTTIRSAILFLLSRLPSYTNQVRHVRRMLNIVLMIGSVLQRIILR